MNPLLKLSDEELLPDLIAGSEHVFAVLFERYNKNIYQFIYKYVHSGAIADDLTQEVFIKIWDGRKQLGHVQSFKGYLLISARNHTLNSLKAALRAENSMGEVVKNFVTQRKAATDERLLETDYAAFLQRELAKLPERTREIFQLCRQEGKTYDEVALELRISKSAVKNHMVSSMKLLKNSVEKELGVALTVILALLFIR